MNLSKLQQPPLAKDAVSGSGELGVRLLQIIASDVDMAKAASLVKLKEDEVAVLRQQIEAATTRAVNDQDWVAIGKQAQQREEEPGQVMRHGWRFLRP
jgi:hypothetical protein